MTCIVGFKTDNKVYLAGDSSAVELESQYSEVWVSPKVFKKQDCVFGYSGMFRVGQLLQYSFTLPTRHKESFEEYLITRFVPAFKRLLEKEGIKESWNLLIGHGSELYAIDSEYSVGVIRDSYMAIGFGRDYALGAMYLASRVALDLSVNDILKLAIASAAHYSHTVREPVTIIST